jgi:hypothetical protein
MATSKNKKSGFETQLGSKAASAERGADSGVGMVLRHGG